MKRSAKPILLGPRPRCHFPSPYCSQTPIRSRRRSFVVAQHSTEASTATDGLGPWRWNAERHDQFVGEALMVALAMIMPHVFVHCAAQHRNTDRHQFR